MENMKNCVKRIWAAAAVLLAVRIFAAIPMNVSAEELTPGYTDPYAVSFAPENPGWDYPFCQPYMYIAPFLTEHRVTDEAGNPIYEGNHFPVIYNLINAHALQRDGVGPYASIGAYSADVTKDVQKNTMYRRIDLEDSGCFGDLTAGKIRAVILNSFPYRQTEAISVRANSWLREQGLPELEQLQSGEVILATQIVLWTIIHEENYTSLSLYAGRKDLTTADWSAYTAGAIDANAIHQKETAHTAQNIQGLFAYFCGLDPVEKKTDLLSEHSLRDPVYTCQHNGDGTYTVTVGVTVAAEINLHGNQPDSIQLSAFCEGQTQSVMLEKGGEYQFVFSGLPGCADVELELNGYQNGADVYLFEEQGDREAPHRLVGYDTSYLPVHGRIVVNGETENGQTPESRQLWVDMDVGRVNCNTGFWDSGEVHSWLIHSEIPEGISFAEEYKIRDILDHRLSLCKGSICAALVSVSGEVYELKESSHYSLSEGTVLTEYGMVDCFTLTLLPAGMAYAEANADSGSCLQIRFEAFLNEDATVGTSIPNTAQITYRNRNGIPWEGMSDSPQIQTGGLNLLAADEEGNPVSGAVFRIARPAREAELLDDAVKKESLWVEGKNIAVVYPAFHPAASLWSEKSVSVTTDAEGKASLYGLAYGTYYLVQTSAPDGFVLPSQPTKVTIYEASHLTEADQWMDADGQVVDKTIRITNARFMLPNTGGSGTRMFTIGGLMILMSACMLLLNNRRRK